MTTNAKKTLTTKKQKKARANDRSLSQRAYEQIKNEILRGDLCIGDLLSRRKLADRLNVSFLPVTEALQRLEAEGLVESKSRIGTRVRIPTEQDILNSYVIREALESQAARLCAQHADSEAKKQITSSAIRLDELQRLCQTDAADPAFLFSVHTYHMQFHMRVAELSECPGLQTAIEREQILIFNWLYDVAAHRQTLPAGFHATLAKALCSGSVAKADRAMRAHVRYGLDQVLDWVRNIEHGDKWRQRSAKK